jgi:hypothetical protein
VPRIIAWVAAVVLVLSTCSASASDDPGCTPTGSTPSYQLGPVAVFHTSHTTFVYLETNGVPGIQRNDTLNERRAPDETCGAAFDQPVTGLYH